MRHPFVVPNPLHLEMAKKGYEAFLRFLAEQGNAPVRVILVGNDGTLIPTPGLACGIADCIEVVSVPKMKAAELLAYLTDECPLSRRAVESLHFIATSSLGQAFRNDNDNFEMLITQHITAYEGLLASLPNAG
jgi:hypothetical protein